MSGHLTISTQVTELLRVQRDLSGSLACSHQWATSRSQCDRNCRILSDDDVLRSLQ